MKKRNIDESNLQKGKTLKLFPVDSDSTLLERTETPRKHPRSSRALVSLFAALAGGRCLDEKDGSRWPTPVEKRHVMLRSVIFGFKYLDVKCVIRKSVF
uniref:Transposase n=1 Tax=Panagrellus redivivus TaxID=6233 RepID=A0A7E4VFJ8_PANRE